MILEKLVSVLALSVTLLKGGMDVAMPDKNIDGTFYLVNRQHMISENYSPEVRVVNAYGMKRSMRDDAATALEEMFAAAKAEKVGLSTVSGYRSYTKQKTIYSRKQKSTDEETANSLVALPGSSEHQMGMAMDLAQKGGSQLNSGFGNTKAGQWINANAWKYGFIVRYPKDQTAITGYAFEPWHVRYVGKAYAKAIFDSDEVMETYVSAHRLETYDFLIKQANEVHP